MASLDLDKQDKNILLFTKNEKNIALYYQVI